jgi:hypothetical protein
MSGPLSNAHTITRRPAQDLERARACHRDKLGSSPSRSAPVACAMTTGAYAGETAWQDTLEQMGGGGGLSVDYNRPRS